jgi:hypothetical protein
VVSITTRSKFAAVAELQDLLLARVVDQDLVVDVFFAELVFDHGDLVAMLLGEHAFEQGGFARAQKAGEDGGGDETLGHIDALRTKTNPLFSLHHDCWAPPCLNPPLLAQANTSPPAKNAASSPA